MSQPGSMNVSGCQFGQHMVDQRPKFDNSVRKRRKNRHQAQGKTGLLRPDKRYRTKWL